MIISALILAAGEGSRLGQPKALMKFNDQTALDLSIDLFAIPEIEQTVVVLGAQFAQILKAHHLDDVTVVENTSWPKGMLSSVQLGLSSFEKKPDFVVMQLVDYLLVCPLTIQALLLRALVSKSPLTLPYFQGQTGHPIVLGRSAIESVAKLPETATPREALGSYRQKAQLVDVQDPGILYDVDTSEKLTQAQRAHEKFRAKNEEMNQILFGPSKAST